MFTIHPIGLVSPGHSTIIETYPIQAVGSRIKSDKKPCAISVSGQDEAVNNMTCCNNSRKQQQRCAPCLDLRLSNSAANTEKNVMHSVVVICIAKIDKPPGNVVLTFPKGCVLYRKQKSKIIISYLNFIICKQLHTSNQKVEVPFIVIVYCCQL